MKLYTHSRLYCFGLKILLYIEAAVGDSNQLGCLVKGAITRCFTFHNETRFRPEASEKCNSSGSHLAMVDREEVSSIMNSMFQQIGWFRLRYKHYDEWKYINNRADSSSLLSSLTMSGDFHHCVAFDTQNGFMSTACSERNVFLCQVPNNQGCSSMPDGSCFEFVNTSLSWYKARNECVMGHGGDLITPHNNITAYLSNELNYISDKIWIGAANGAWVWKDGENDPVLGEAVYSNWAPGHPNGSNDCAVVNLMDGTWVSIGCNGDGRYYICELVMPSNITTEAVVPTSSTATISTKALIAISTTATVSTKAFVQTSMLSKVSSNATDQTPTTLTRDLTDTSLSNSTPVSTTTPLEDMGNDGKLRIIIIAAACGGGGLFVIIVVIVAAVAVRRRKSEQKRSDSEDDLTPRNSTAYELGSQHVEGTDNAGYQNIAHKPTHNPYEDVPEFNEHKGEMHGAIGSSIATSSVDDHTYTNRNDDTERTGSLPYKISDQGNLYAVPVKANDDFGDQVFVTEQNDLYNK